MGEVLGISRRFQKPAPALPESSTAKSSSAAPSDTATPAVPEEEGTIRVKRKDLRRAEGILKDILAGRRVRMSAGASCQADSYCDKIPDVVGEGRSLGQGASYQHGPHDVNLFFCSA